MCAWHAFYCTPILAHMIGWGGGGAPVSIPGLPLHHPLYPLQRCDSVWGNEALVHFIFPTIDIASQVLPAHIPALSNRLSTPYRFFLLVVY